VLEALSYGTPIVTTSVGIQGMPEASSLVDVCETADDFGAAVVEILLDPNLRLQRVLDGLDFIARTASERAARRVLSQDVPELS